MQTIRKIASELVRTLEEEEEQRLPTAYHSPSVEVSVGIGDLTDDVWLQRIDDHIRDEMFLSDLLRYGCVLDGLVADMGLPASIERINSPELQRFPVKLGVPETSGWTSVRVGSVQHANIVGCEISEKYIAAQSPVVPLKLRVTGLPGKALVRGSTTDYAAEVVDHIFWGERSEVLTAVLTANDTQIEQRKGTTVTYWKRTPFAFCVLLDYAMHNEDARAKMASVFAKHLFGEYKLPNDLADDALTFNRRYRQKTTTDVCIEYKRADDGEWLSTWSLAFELVLVICK